ncbi:hypothetical protein PVAP13_4KG382502 [Panicum virgatum]|uniref:Uncharacterized protein n=1 Tax=Panicum virgatum TaxID=38727 RepID=A0A8T0TZF6_PANVG|nr:hypothetical protein PVAP13_4KG382502 [Panicum virgatum]
MEYKDCTPNLDCVKIKGSKHWYHSSNLIQRTLFYGSSALRCVEADTPSRANRVRIPPPTTPPPPALIFFPTKLDAGLLPAVFELLRAAVNRERSGLRAPPSPSAPHPFRRFRRPALALHPPPALLGALRSTPLSRRRPALVLPPCSRVPASRSARRAPRPSRRSAGEPSSSA